jgi:tRNA(Ile)-lysidine synthase
LVTALIVDHGLRPESAAEAREVAAWLTQRGIRRHILIWQGHKPVTAIQAAAREARYALLAGWCREAGVLHLLLGHHRDDQAETVALRAARRSGPDGLAGMAPVREIAGLRLLRPLLSVPKASLLATLRAAGQAWIDDPSNRAPRFARTHLRQRPPAPVDAAGDAEVNAEARAALDRRTAAWLAATARIDPAGFVTWPRDALAHAPPAVARRALQQALVAVGGQEYPPRRARLDRLLEALLAVPACPGRTLAGCRILAWGDDLLICREPAAIAPPLRLTPNVWHHWDQRFAVFWAVRWQACEDAVAQPIVRALGEGGWRECRRHAAAGAPRDLPLAVRAGLASAWRDEQLLAVAGLRPIAPTTGRPAITFRSRPRRPLAGAPFAALSPSSAPAPYQRIARDDTFASI